MGKLKADVVIYGDLICKEKLQGGGKIYVTSRKELESFFDIDGACVVRGNVETSSFDSGEKVVVVCGAVAVKGGLHEQ